MFFKRKIDEKEVSVDDLIKEKCEEDCLSFDDAFILFLDQGKIPFSWIKEKPLAVLVKNVFEDNDSVNILLKLAIDNGDIDYWNDVFISSGRDLYQTFNGDNSECLSIVVSTALEQIKKLIKELDWDDCSKFTFLANLLKGNDESTSFYYNKMISKEFNLSEWGYCFQKLNNDYFRENLENEIIERIKERKDSLSYRDWVFIRNNIESLRPLSLEKLKQLQR